MPITVNHIFTCPQPDIPAQAALGYVVPTDWNSVHTATVGLNSSEAIHVSAGTQSASSGMIVFADSNGIAFGMSGNSQITASYTVPAGGAPGISGSNGSFTFNTVTFGSSNGMHFYTTNGSMVGSYTQSGQALSGSNGSFAFQTATFGSSNGMHFYTTNGSIVGSYTVPTQSTQPVAVSGSNGSFSFATVTFGSSNGMHFYTTNGSMVGSYTVPTQSNQTLGLYAVSNTTGESSSSTFDARTLSFHGAGVASVGYSNGSVVISVPAGGGGLTNIKVSAGTSSAHLSAITFADSNGISFGLNGSTITARQITLSGWDPMANVMIRHISSAAFRQSTLMFAPYTAPNVQFDRAIFSMSISNASNSSGSATLSAYIGIYTKNASSLSLLVSTSTSIAMTHSGTAGNYSLNSGVRAITVPFTTTLSQSNYWIGILMRSASGGADCSILRLVQSGATTTMAGIFGAAIANSYQQSIGLGYYSTSTSGMPAAVHFSELTGTVAPAYPAQICGFASETV